MLRWTNVVRKQNGYAKSWRIFRDGQNLCLQYAYIVIVNLQLAGHRARCIMVSLDTFVVDIIPSNNYSQLGVISIDYVRSKDNIADPLTKGLKRELVDKSSRGMGLKPIGK